MVHLAGPKAGSGDDRRDHALYLPGREAVPPQLFAKERGRNSQPSPDPPLGPAQVLARGLGVSLVDPEAGPGLQRPVDGLQAGLRLLPVVKRLDRESEVEFLRHNGLLDRAGAKLQVRRPRSPQRPSDHRLGFVQPHDRHARTGLRDHPIEASGPAADVEEAARRDRNLQRNPSVTRLEVALRDLLVEKRQDRPEALGPGALEVHWARRPRSRTCSSSNIRTRAAMTPARPRYPTTRLGSSRATMGSLPIPRSSILRTASRRSSSPYPTIGSAVPASRTVAPSLLRSSARIRSLRVMMPTSRPFSSTIGVPWRWPSGSPAAIRLARSATVMLAVMTGTLRSMTSSTRWISKGSTEYSRTK